MLILYLLERGTPAAAGAAAAGEVTSYPLPTCADPTSLALCRCGRGGGREPAIACLGGGWRGQQR